MVWYFYCTELTLLTSKYLFYSTGVVNSGHGTHSSLSYVSLLPSDTPFVALTATATATKSVTDQIVNALHMSPPVSILLTPNRANIRYAVQSASRDVHDSFNWILEDLKRERVNLERTVVFCRSITTCLYHQHPVYTTIDTLWKLYIS